MDNQRKIKSLVFMDMETTGLPGLNMPKSVQCTEISLIAIHREHFDDQHTDFRVINKLSLCIQPKSLVQPAAVNLTGLDNNILETQKTFSVTTAEFLFKFLDLLEQPICLLSHNGLKFDFPLLKSELKKANQALSSSVLCLDTYLALLEILPAIEYVDQTLHGVSALQVEGILNNGRILREASEITPPHETHILEDPTTPKSVNYPSYFVTPPNHVDVTKSTMGKATECQSTQQNKENQISPVIIDLTDSPNSKSPSSTPVKYPFPVYSPEYLRTGNEVSLFNVRKAKRSLFPSTEEVHIKKSTKVENSNSEKPIPAPPITVKHKNNKTPLQYSKGYKLEDLHKKLIGTDLSDAHFAEADTFALMKVCHRVKDFSLFMDGNAILFSEVSPMW